MSKIIKILCTLGPSSLNPSVIRRLSEEEVDLFRINLSHTSLESLEKHIKIIKSSSNVPICLDSQGAQVRTGFMGEEKLRLNAGSIVNLVSNSEFVDDKHIPIYPDDKILKSMPDYALLLAWNFSKEIVSNNIQYLKKGGKFIIPIPKVKIISYKEK